MSTRVRFGIGVGVVASLLMCSVLRELAEAFRGMKPALQPTRLFSGAARHFISWESEALSERLANRFAARHRIGLPLKVGRPQRRLRKDRFDGAKNGRGG